MKTSGLFAACLVLVHPVTVQAQDYASSSKAFKRSLQQMSVPGVRRAAVELSSINTSAAVGILHSGFGACTKQIKATWGEKARWRKQMALNSDFEVDYTQNPPIVKSSSVNKFLKFEEAEKKAQAVERKIMKIEAMRNAIIQALAGISSDRAQKPPLAACSGRAILDAWRDSAGGDSNVARESTRSLIGTPTKGVASSPRCERIGADSSPRQVQSDSRSTTAGRRSDPFSAPRRTRGSAEACPSMDARLSGPF